MPISFSLTEPGRRGFNPVRPFGLNADGVHIHEILRLLTGSVNLRVVESGRYVPLCTDEIRRKRNRSARPESIVELLFSRNISIEEYEKFVVSASIRNRAFFAELLRELALCLGARKLGRNTESFLYFYRILEYISVAFPMLYASSEHEFRKSHKFLKDLMLNERDGELKVLERAIPIIGQENELHLISFDFRVVGYQASFVDELRRQAQRVLAGKVRGLEIESDGDVIFRVPFNSMSSLIVNIRNRMFHYKIGEANFDLGMLGGSENFCKLILSESIYWFGVLFSEMVRTLAKRQILSA